MRILAMVSVTLVVLTIASTAVAKIPPTYKNCTAVNKKYRHGVGRANAHDKTTGTPVRTFVHSNKLYRLAVSYNAGLDRDKDGIACEKA